MATFKDRVFGSQVDPKIIQKFQELAGGNPHASNILSEVKPTFKKYLGERTPFSRMWCAVNINTLPKTGPNGELVKRNSKGAWYYHPNENKDSSKIVGTDADSETLVFSVNENREKSYDKNILESMQKGSTGNVRYVSQLSEELGAGNPYMKPAAGITSVTSKTQGALGAIRSTVVEFVVHNRHDFENIFLPYFLRPGAVVCVDYGWSDDSFQLYDPINQIKDKSLDMSEFDKFIYHKETGFLIKNQGLVNTVMGNVVTYDSSINSDGSFQCSLEITSRNTGILDKEISEDNKLRFIFTNVIDDIIRISLAKAIGVDEQILNKNLALIKKSISGELSNELKESLQSKDYEQKSLDFLNELDFGRELNKSTGKDLLSSFAKKQGIFYQDITNNTHWGNTAAKFLGGAFRKVSKTSAKWIDNTRRAIFTEDDPRELLYISWGRFEDMFLNNFVSGTVKNKTKTSEDGTEHLYKSFETDIPNPVTQYDSRESFVRWDEDLYTMQQQALGPQDSLPSFIIPKEISSHGRSKGDSYDSYNVNVIKNTKSELYDQDWFPKDCSVKVTTGEYEGKNIIPFRDVFVSVPLITSTFAQFDNVNDALLQILDTLNEDTYKVWNLKIVGGSDNSNNHISIYDSNLQPKISDNPKENLIFDVTSETSIVSQCNLQFTTPKDGLGSMIAIDSISSPRRFKQHNLSALNNLNLLNKPQFTDKKSNADQYVSIVSLPLQHTNTNDEFGAFNLDFNTINTGINNQTADSGNTDAFANAKDKFKASIEDIGIVQENVKKAKEENLKDQPIKFSKNRVQVADSIRDEYRIRLKERVYDSSDENTISPILPIELDLSIYGNNYLNIGDYYNINYLPSQYKDRTYFQIVGIEDKIDLAGWTTSYTSVMRVIPTKKSIVNGLGPVTTKQFESNKDEIKINKESHPHVYDLSGGKKPGYDDFQDITKNFELNFGDGALAFNVYKYNYSKAQDNDEAFKGLDYHMTSALGKLTELKKIQNVAYAYAVRNVLLSTLDGVQEKNNVDIFTNAKNTGNIVIGQLNRSNQTGAYGGYKPGIPYKVLISDEDDVENLLNLYDDSYKNEEKQTAFQNALIEIGKKNVPEVLKESNVGDKSVVSFNVLEGGEISIPTVGNWFSATSIKEAVFGTEFSTKVPTFMEGIAIRNELDKRVFDNEDVGGEVKTYDKGEEIYTIQQTSGDVSVFPFLYIPKIRIEPVLGIQYICKALNVLFLKYQQILHKHLDQFDK
mgnify:CR=1 FL=1